jgi:hypothetical protein
VETQLVVGICLVATIGVAAVYSAAHGPVLLLGILLFGVVVAGGTLGAVMGWIPRGEVFFILVLLVIAGIPIAPEQLPYVMAVGIGGAAFSIALTLAGGGGSGRILRTRVRAGSAALDPVQHVIVILAAAIGSVCAWLIPQWLGVGHPFWAPITVAAMMPALTSADAFRRASRLMTGTLVGVCFAALLFSPHPGVLTLMCLIAACQVIAELFVARNYALALVFISPLAIGMSNLGRGLPWGPLLIERVLETAAGIGVALVTIIIGRQVLAVAMARALPGRSG